MVIFFKKIFKHWLPVFLLAGLIFYLSNQPELKSGFEFDFYLRKAAHVLEYFALTFLLHTKKRWLFRQSSLFCMPPPTSGIKVLFLEEKEKSRT
ncbi:MAG: hypothetical protein UX51_C0053G0009 [Candidatus Azambacteria bacterium GW2011_GWF2_46_32]|uniref:Uncharacterized protein n=1 Tax=Candidatus Azambacteria bacterium GW2011_GWF2_46_32 TaxID=1618628 RepID=A0A0G1PTU5_9BACT|nr:MAG: hypothetical protein UX51_C0053G0009 [Candidatus Azambacteria bacterium GW2011_GWF2_46_32]